MVKNKKSMQEEKSGKKAGGMHAEKQSDQLKDQQVKDKEDKKSKYPEEGNTETQTEEETEAQTEAQTEEETEAQTEEEEALATLEERLNESENKYLRLAAEFDNYRKRTLREKAELTKLAGESILGGLLPVIDDFDRAVESMNQTSGTDAIKKGVELIHVKFREFLKQKGVKEIQALGNEFNTDLHEAVTKIPVNSKKDKGKIVDVVEKGYLLHDKVLRYAKVVVGE